MDRKKHSGILCHVTSLPTSYGIGDFGPQAYAFIDDLARSGQKYWQILPIGNTDDSGCPYATDSAFGCADYYVSPDLLMKDYEIDPALYHKFILNTERVDFKRAKVNKREALQIAYAKFLPSSAFHQFLKDEKDWVVDYATFRTLSETRGQDFRAWGKAELTSEEQKLVDFHLFCQFVCFSQLLELKKYANSKNIKLVGDLPIFVSYNSMDVWKNPQEFYLNDKLEMEYETGAAPDAFSKTGQKWGTPIYNWKAQKADNFEWWNKRLSFLKRYFDVIRIDHFRGFVATWISKVSAPDASEGQWYEGPGEELFRSLRDYPEIIAEDLGYITPEVEKLRKTFNFPSMRVLEFMLGGANNPHKLTNYEFDTVAYTGTHDCDTLMGWFKSLSKEDKERVEHDLQVVSPNHWEMISVLMSSPSRIVFIQIQDLLGLGSEARFNYPGTVQPKNWSWKLEFKDERRIDWQKLGMITAENDRVEKKAVCG
nr:4-alpha-glucanotransferase [Bacteriovorax sp. HI3]